MAKKDATKTNTAPAPAAPVAPVPPAPPLAGPIAPPAPPVVTAPPAAAPVHAPPVAYVPPFAVPPPPSSQPTQNGVQKPGPNTSTGYVWDVCDFITTDKAKRGLPCATRNEVVQACAVAGTNVSTAMTQYGKWAKFYGYSRPQTPSAPVAPVAPAVAAPVAPVAPPAPVAPVAVANPYQDGYDAYGVAAGGGSPVNNYTEGSAESGQYLAGWNQAHADSQAAQ